MIGKNVVLPIVNRPIPIIADEYCEAMWTIICHSFTFIDVTFFIIFHESMTNSTTKIVIHGKMNVQKVFQVRLPAFFLRLFPDICRLIPDGTKEYRRRMQSFLRISGNGWMASAPGMWYWIQQPRSFAAFCLPRYPVALSIQLVLNQW